MKDLTITRRMQRRELFTLLACFIIACLLNLYAIIAYDGKAIEMLSSLGYVLIFTVALYVVWTAIRIIFYTILQIKKKKQK